MQKSLLLTFDLEEFDLLLEYTDINKKKIFSTSSKGCKKILRTLDTYEIRCTFFTTTRFAEECSELVKKIVKEGHEVSLHGYKHSDDFSEMNKRDTSRYLRRAKQELEKITKRKIIGFRHPGLKKPPFNALRHIGIQYDSSIHPTYIPGRYNNFFHNRKCHKIKGVIEVPISVTPVLRAPFSWIWFRNFGLNYVKACTSLASLNSSFINLYLHPWEFVNLQEYDIPLIIKRSTGRNMEKMLEDYIEWCTKNGFKFSTIGDFLNR